jgi:hypothetical protein
MAAQEGLLFLISGCYERVLIPWDFYALSSLLREGRLNVNEGRNVVYG